MKYIIDLLLWFSALFTGRRSGHVDEESLRRGGPRERCSRSCEEFLHRWYVRGDLALLLDLFHFFIALLSSRDLNEICIIDELFLCD